MFAVTGLFICFTYERWALVQSYYWPISIGYIVLGYQTFFTCIIVFLDNLPKKCCKKGMNERTKLI